ncbi:MAG: sterol desaturase family protein [Bacteroidetes bacterium]|nr:sterol desaturase family protein [Bacteroidota bacterium]MBS1632971.1 sterol desaturase family protein [Bacteroidota bacterium]
MDNISSYQSLLDVLKQWLPYYIVAMVAAESIYLLVRFKQAYSKETWVNISTGVVTIIVQAILKTFLFTDLYPFVYEHRLWDLELNGYTLLLGFFMYTFIQFGTHYVYHKSRIFWCLHEVHHSAIKMNATTGLRTSIFDIVSLDILYLLIPLCGIHPIVYFILYSLNKIWGTFIHFNEKIVSRIPILEYLLVTPGTHHIHHASNIRYLDKNFGEVIPWFDQLLGTYARRSEPIVYGTTTVTHELGFWEAQVHEFRSLWHDVKNAKGLGNKIKYIFLAPGWQPGDLTGTARYVQKKYFEDLKSGITPEPVALANEKAE